MNAYQELGLRTSASDEVIVRAYRQKLKDIQENFTEEQAAERKKRLDFANSILSDPQRRARYDRLLQKNAQAADFDRLYEKHISTPPPPPPKMPFGKRMGNFWYHYKALVIAGALVAVVGVFLVTTSDKGPKPDLRILLTGEYFLSDLQAETLGKALEPYIADRNADSLKTLDIINTASPPDAAQMYTAYRSKFMAELALGDKVLLILDKPNIQQLSAADGEVFSDLSLYEPSLPSGTRAFELSSSPLISKAFADSGYKLPEGMLAVLLMKNEDKYAKKAITATSTTIPWRSLRR